MFLISQYIEVDLGYFQQTNNCFPVTGNSISGYREWNGEWKWNLKKLYKHTRIYTLQEQNHCLMAFYSSTAGSRFIFCNNTMAFILERAKRMLHVSMRLWRCPFGGERTSVLVSHYIKMREEQTIVTHVSANRWMNERCYSESAGRKLIIPAIKQKTGEFICCIIAQRPWLGLIRPDLSGIQKVCFAILNLCWGNTPVTRYNGGRGRKHNPEYQAVLWWEGSRRESFTFEERGCPPRETHMERPPRVHPGIGGLRGGAGQYLEVSLPVLQERWR